MTLNVTLTNFVRYIHSCVLVSVLRCIVLIATGRLTLPKHPLILDCLNTNARSQDGSGQFRLFIELLH